MLFGDEQIGSGSWNLYRDLVRKEISKTGCAEAAARHWAASRTPNAPNGSNQFEVICLKVSAGGRGDGMRWERGDRPTVEKTA